MASRNVKPQAGNQLSRGYVRERVWEALSRNEPA
ncbi:hypothetical protein PQD73_gp061 [Stenotrophomonas phage Salva]|uniref:Uncharacterized protein n=1 Tax=Stenotrophomonas phage Salva TaxID=2801524 RepID=A0A8B6Q870_9CAUD|nr:hypothetical protein PQD73_gp061 [Stenotrophomonas phage Salva]QQM18225.1 hypothetical protein CPT_Salva_061 [Stenotrophomonas phage Salva]